MTESKYGANYKKFKERYILYRDRLGTNKSSEKYRIPHHDKLGTNKSSEKYRIPHHDEQDNFIYTPLKSDFRDYTQRPYDMQRYYYTPKPYDMPTFDYTPIPYDNNPADFEGDMVNATQLKGWRMHGIGNNIITLMQILKSKMLLSQASIKARSGQMRFMTLGQDHNRDFISFTLFGVGGIWKSYGENGMCFISKNLKLVERRSNCPFEWFHEDVNINELILGISSVIAYEPVQPPSSKNISNFISQNIMFLYQEFGGDIDCIVPESLSQGSVDIFMKCFNKLFGGRLLIDIVKELCAKYEVDIKIVVIDFAK